MEFTGERFIPGETDIELQLEHMNRYQFARQFVGNMRVLDAACGAGYGTDLLARDAEHVVGIDISEESITYAQERYVGKRVTFLTASIASLPFEDKSFDVVVSFETLEHVEAVVQAKFLDEVVRVLADDGVLVISTPNHSIYQKRGLNTFHVKELDYIEFKQMLEEHFQHTRFFNQQFEVCNAISDARSGVAWIEGGQTAQEAEYLIAVCSNQKFGAVGGRVIIRNDKKLEQLVEWASFNHKENENKNVHIHKLDMQIEKLERARRVCEAENAQNIAQLHDVAEKMKQLEGECQRYLAESVACTEQIDLLKTENERNIAQIRQLEQRCQEYIRKLQESDTEYQVKEHEWQQTLQDKEEHIGQLSRTIQNKEGHIEQLLVSDRELARIRSSRSWRFMGYVWKVRDILVPQGSKRRLIIKTLVKFVKHPIRFLRKASPKRVLKFFRVLKKEGPDSVSRRLDDCLIDSQLLQQEMKITLLPIESVKTISDYAPIAVPQWEAPQVSIVIPAYNQFDFTYQCIRSIIEHSGKISYEIILADDCSTDLTQEIGQVVWGLLIERNEKNLRFLKNCNRAAQRAKGQYILFLNNDTQVQADWLAPLVELIERDPKIGMVGSKLVYPDGRLQEAGGILWQDGSAWNYGNRSDPAEPEFNYVKEVDYISGASIMIRRSLWEKIGGFDERFAPAYCEDSDLAFAVREKGCRVMYQPLSVVVHFEGISNGSDTSTGQKAYQIVNQKKFFEKWKHVLESGHFPNAEHVFSARDRSRSKKTILMVDHYVPQYDKDAGSRTVFQYLQMFAAHGYHIKFIGDNFYPHQPYTQVLQQMGIEVLYGPYYAKHWKDWLQENGASIQYVFLNRPHISVKYIDEVRQKTNAKIIYYGHDLHFLREQREYEVTKEISLLKSSKEWKKKELELMRKADISYYPSCVEVEEIHRIASEIQVKAIPAYLFAEVSEVSFHAGDRHELMFIGGFGHRPNIDAVKWLAQEIMPELKKLLPGVRVHILGSNPPKEITDLADEQLLIEGFVTDEQLEMFYRTCRMALVPLRYGAGIKGKIVEAMRYGLPVVTTSVGAEGISGADEILRIADTAKAFAQKAAAIYKDEKVLEKMSRSSIEYVREHFSPESAVAIIGEDFDMEEQMA